MIEEIKFLEYLKTPRTDNDLIKKFEIKTDELLTKYIIKDCIEQKGEFWKLKKEGISELKELKQDYKNKNDTSIKSIHNGDIHYYGDSGQIVTSPINSSIVQKNKIKKVPPKFEYSSNPMVEWLLEHFGKKVSSWVFGTLSALSVSGYSLYGATKGFLPEISDTNPFSGIFSIQSLLFGIFIIFITIFISIKGHAKKKRCPKCNKILSHISYGDGEVLDESPTHALKVKRNYRCPCGYQYSRTGWEYPVEKKK
jgi:hypothetical protein